MKANRMNTYKQVFFLPSVIFSISLSLSGCGLIFAQPSVEEAEAAPDDGSNGSDSGDEDAVGTLTVSPTQNSGYPEDLIRLQAQETFSDADRETEDITAACSWQSSDESVATVTSPGVLLAIAPGTTVVTVTYGEQQQTAAVEVLSFETGLVELTVDPPELEVPVNFSANFKAMGFTKTVKHAN